MSDFLLVLTYAFQFVNLEFIPGCFECGVLTAGFLGLEALDQDSQHSQICGFCGVVPEVCLGNL